MAEAGPADIDHAVSAARRAFETSPWPKMAPAERAHLLWKLADMIQEADEVVHFANATHYGLAAAVWTRDFSQAHRMAAKLRAGKLMDQLLQLV